MKVKPRHERLDTSYFRQRSITAGFCPLVVTLTQSDGDQGTFSFSCEYLQKMMKDVRARSKSFQEVNDMFLWNA